MKEDTKSKLAALILNPWFAVTMNCTAGAFFTGMGIWGWLERPESIATAVNLWCGGIWFGYAIMSAIRPRVTEKWKRETYAEMDKMGREMIERVNREMLRTMWSPTITPPDDQPPMKGRLQ